jgi:mannose-6-phosphate isomerase-like protein (cupin superfamily)
MADRVCGRPGVRRDSGRWKTYTSAFSCELVQLGPGDQTLTHVEDSNHLLYFVEGSGEITIGDTEMLILTVYDPPRVRE